MDYKNKFETTMKESLLILDSLVKSVQTSQTVVGSDRVSVIDEVSVNSKKSFLSFLKKKSVLDSGSKKSKFEKSFEIRFYIYVYELYENVQLLGRLYSKLYAERKSSKELFDSARELSAAKMLEIQLELESDSETEFVKGSNELLKVLNNYEKVYESLEETLLIKLKSFSESTVSLLRLKSLPYVKSNQIEKVLFERDMNDFFTVSEAIDQIPLIAKSIESDMERIYNIELFYKKAELFEQEGYCKLLKIIDFEKINSIFKDYFNNTFNK